MHELLDHWADDPESRVVHVHEVASRDAIFQDLDPPLTDPLPGLMSKQGIERLYRHQATAIESVRRGEHTVVVAGTASGKSLCYQLPIAETTLSDPAATSLLLYPTKALAQDQLRSFHQLEVPKLVLATYDGDTEFEQRAWVRKHANAVLTNPDMLHIGILPNHSKWSSFLGRLRHVVIDEMHMLRGIFGSHVGLVLRRLRRLAARYGAEPTFVFSSATIGNPRDLAERLTGLAATVVDQDNSPSGAKTYVLWNPPLLEGEDGRRTSAMGEATDVLVDLLRHGAHTIAFARSRKGTELIYRWARERLPADVAERVAAYRGGYLPTERRKIEADLFGGELLGVVTTNALELGIDVGGLEAAVLSTYPGTISSFRQQAGRAGRSRDHSMAVLVGGQDALDQYFMTHPDELFTRQPEAAVINPENPDILVSHLGCAAYELPLRPDDRRFFGLPTEETATAMVQEDLLSLRDGGLYWKSRRPPAPDVNIRNSGGPPYSIIDGSTRALLGTLDQGSAFTQVHTGAVYLHQGETYVVTRLDLALREAWVEPESVNYYTQPKEEKWIDIVEVAERSPMGSFELAHGRVEVESHVIAYQRKALQSRQVLGYEPLDLPPTRYQTQAFWIVAPPPVIAAAAVDGIVLPGTLHAAEHAAIGMMPLFAICDRWDIGGLSTPMHPDVGNAVWFIYDGYPGGAGIAPIGYARAQDLLSATADLIQRCPCESGCPSCVQSPKCGNFNDPLDKEGALRLVRAGLG